MKNGILLVLIVISQLVFSQDFSFTISGTIPDAQNKTVTLSRWDIDHRKTLRVQETKVNEHGKFLFTVAEEPNLYVLKIASVADINLAIANQQHIKIGLSENGLTATGSTDTDWLQKYEVFRKQSLAKWMNGVRAELRAAKQEGNSEKVKTLSFQENKNYLAHRAELSEWVFKNMGTSIAVYATSSRWTVDDLPEMEILLSKFKKAHPYVQIKRDLESKVARFKTIAKGATVTEITASDTSGSLVSLSSYRGNYVLIDFWASWCGPCRRENESLRKVYQEFHKRGFEIFGVSLDKRKNHWVSAIKKDEMTWVQVSDLEGYTGKVPFAYNITAIPSNVLIDKEGKVIGYNLFGQDLADALYKLLPEN